ncbi:NADH-quinone oxidoreductase subunit C [candidate division KSB1 bacterium]
MTEEKRAEILEIKNEFPESYLKDEEFRGDVSVTVKKDKIFDILKFLKEDENFLYIYLVDITCVDYLKLDEIERFAVVYNLYSYKNNSRIRIKAPVREDDASISTVCTLWKAANWMEREVFDLFGIKFDGHPDLRRILTPDDYTGHPLRKDYPLKGRGERESFKVVK